MSVYPVFPRLPGFSWGRYKTARWKTMIQTSESDLERRWARWSSPRWLFSVPVNVLRADRTSSNELKQIIAFFNALQGSAQSFLIDDREDPSLTGVTGQAIGTGDGVTTDFQLIHNYTYDYGTWVETCKYINPRLCYGFGEGGYGEYRYGTAESPYIYLDGVLQYTGYAISDLGVIQFDTAPALGVVITADFSYFYRVRFDGDDQDFQNLMFQLWDIQSSGGSGSGGGGLNFITVKERET